jgi:hypothetical protein
VRGLLGRLSDGGGHVSNGRADPISRREHESHEPIAVETHGRVTASWVIWLTSEPEKTTRVPCDFSSAYVQSREKFSAKIFGTYGWFHLLYSGSYSSAVAVLAALLQPLRLLCEVSCDCYHSNRIVFATASDGYVLRQVRI